MAGCEWEMEGGKGVLWWAIWKGWYKKKAFGLWKWEIFENSEEGLVQKKSFLCTKRWFLSAIRKAF